MESIRKIVRVLMKVIIIITAIISLLWLTINKIRINSWIGYVILGVLYASVVILSVYLFLDPTSKIFKRKYKFGNLRTKRVSKEFREFYQYLEKQYGVKLENYRRNVIRTIIGMFLFLVLGLIITIITYSTIQLNPKWIFVLLATLASIFIRQYTKNNKIYKEEYKNTIIKEFAKSINENLNYNSDGNEKICDFYEQATYADESYNTIETTDYIGGWIDKDIHVALSAISLQNRRNDELVSTINDVLFAYCQFNGSIPKEVRIKKNRINIVKDRNQVELDDREFEKYFDVFSDSKIISLQILTHDVMQELVNFYESYKIHFEILIRNNGIYIRYETGAVFKPHILRKATDIKTLWIYYNIMKFGISLTAKLEKILNETEI
ncbi:MAG: DUF3137 domain-containing protein [Clostridia bacterium]